MQPLNPVQPGEASALLMENELLRYEVAHLRARLAAVTPAGRPRRKGAQKAPKDQQAQKTQKAPRARHGGATAPALAGDAARNQVAYDDLVWLLGRLDSSPAGLVLRRVAGFRTLRARYLPEPPS